MYCFDYRNKDRSIDFKRNRLNYNYFEFKSNILQVDFINISFFCNHDYL